MEALAILAVLFVLACCFVLPFIAIYRTRNLRDVELRVAGLEAALLRMIRERAASEARAAEQIQQPALGESPAPLSAAQDASAAAAPAPRPIAETPAGVSSPRPSSEAAASPSPAPAAPAPQSLETLIGQKWLGWVAVVLIFFATGFFLKYAFENRWIGEIGRVALGLLGGLALTWLGFERHRRGWRHLSQVLTSGGIALLYLSIYGAFGYYHLIEQRTAFFFLALVVVEAHLLALLYNARAIVVMALAGGFLVPVLLSTGSDQYTVLFGYVALLDLGVLGLLIAQRWGWVRLLAFAGTQSLFWAWHEQHYELEKRGAALLFQAAVFLLFVLADLAQLVRKRAAGGEEFIILVINPFVFYGACYTMLNGDYPHWMGPLAVSMAAGYAALASIAAGVYRAERRVRLVMLGIALTFLTAAIPIQLEAHWITISWTVEAAALAWAGLKTSTSMLRQLSAAIFVLALMRYFSHDIPWGARPEFTPVWNKDFLVTAAVTACLGITAYLYRRANPQAAMLAAVTAGGTLWTGSSIETYSYFAAQATSITHNGGPEASEQARQLYWAGQMALSLLWSLYAAVLAALGFRLKQRRLRSAGLALFGITLVKVVFVDISELRQLYRIVALLALGLLLLRVAWAYQTLLRREQTK